MDFTKDIEFNCNPVAKQDITITYHGFLNQSDSVFIVYGFGENWENTTEKEMSKMSSEFSAKITMLDFDTFNFCFRNADGQWDNNSNCNYIASISPCVAEKPVIQNFDIDSLIEEILQPLIVQTVPEEQKEIETVTVTSKPIDLSIELGAILSELDNTPVAEEPFRNYSSLEEILSCEIISNTPIDELENKIACETTSQTEKTSLALEEKFVVSPRKLNKFHLFRKRIILTFYKALIKIPNLLFGKSEEQE